MARGLVVVAGVVVFASGLAGTEPAIAGIFSSHLGSSRVVHPGHENLGHENSGPESLEIPGGKPPTGGSSTRAGKLYLGLRTRWRAWRADRLQRWFDGVVTGMKLKTNEPAVFLMQEFRWTGRPRWWLFSMNGKGQVFVALKESYGYGEPREEDLVSSDEVGKALVEKFGFTNKIGRVSPQNGRFTSVIEALNKDLVTSVDIFETWREFSFLGKQSLWRVLKNKNKDDKYPFRVASLGTTSKIGWTSQHLSATGLTIALAKLSRVDSALRVLPATS